MKTPTFHFPPTELSYQFSPNINGKFEFSQLSQYASVPKQEEKEKFRKIFLNLQYFTPFVDYLNTIS